MMIDLHWRFWVAGLATVAAGALASAQAQAQIQKADCYEFLLEVGSGQRADGVANICLDAARDSLANDVTKGLAWRHAAIASFKSNQPNLSDALGFMNLSYTELGNSDSNLVLEGNLRLWDRKKLGRRDRRAHEPARQAFLFTRATDFADIALAANAAGQCDPSCARNALDALEDPVVSGILFGYRTSDPAQVSRYYFLKGRLNESIGTNRADEAISAYRQVDRTSSNWPEARGRIAAIALAASGQYGSRSRAELEQKISYLRQVLQPDIDPNNLQVLASLGDAYGALARPPINLGEAEFRNAELAYTQFLTVQGGTGADAAVMEGRLGSIYADWAKYIEARANNVPAELRRAEEYRELAIVRFERAAAAGATSPDAQIMIADDAFSKGNWAGAAAAYGNAAGIFENLPTPQLQSAGENYLKQANAHKLNNDIVAKGVALANAERVDRSSAKIAMERAAFLSDQGSVSAARGLYAGVAGLSNTRSYRDAEIHRGRAYYELSLLDLQTAARRSNGSPIASDAIISYADQAIAYGTDDGARYRRHACLVRVLGARKWILEANQAHCLSGGTADTNLVKAMFLMRRAAAQYSDNDRYDSNRAQIRRRARDAFLPINPNDRNINFEGFGLPGEPVRRADPQTGQGGIKREAYLLFLKEITELCNFDGGGRAELPERYKNQRSMVLDFWNYYQMTECVA
ncbi:MAG: hypothetical protein AAFY34_10425 [Pseudomonadota bacterium]